VEEKMIKINMPRYYGYKVVDFNDSKIPYNALPLTQHYTRTVVEDLELPSPSASASTAPEVADQGDKNTSSEDALVKATREDVIEALEFAHDYYKWVKLGPIGTDRVLI